MTRSLCSLVLLLGAAIAANSASMHGATEGQAVAEVRLPASSGYLAEVEVWSGGVTRHGRLIITQDGCVHLEHFDAKALSRLHELIRPDPPASKGWDDRIRRASPTRRVWVRLGQTDALAEIHAPDASLKVMRHQLLVAR
jgi:hypothetical protein